MKVRRLGNSETELTVGEWIILFSYEVPVAANEVGKGFYKTSKFHSVTTSKHINKWLAGAKATEKDQQFFDDLKDTF